MVEINFANLPPQQGYTVDLDAVRGYDVGTAASDAPPEVNAFPFSSNDLRIRYREREPGSVIDWHTHDPNVYQVYVPLEGEMKLKYRDNDGDEHATTVGPGELAYLPPGAHNRLEWNGDDRARMLSVEPTSTVSRIERVADPTEPGPGDRPYTLDLDTLRGDVESLDEDAVTPY